MRTPAAAAPALAPALRALVLTLALVLAAACRREPSPGGAPPLPSAASATAAPATPATATTGFPLRAPDGRGRVVVLPALPRRIVALLPSHTETLFALGVGDRVVGVDDFSDYPAEVSRLPKLGGAYATQLESVLALKPDLVLLSESSRAAEALEQAGVVVWAGSARRFDEIFTIIDTIGSLVGRISEARSLAERIRVDVASVEDALRGTKRATVYYELDATPYSVGPASFIGVLLTKAGGTNIIPASLGDFPKISPEIVVSKNPSIILGPSLDDVAVRPGWGNLDAVRSRRVYKLQASEADLIGRPGPRIAEALRVLARRLHPELSL